MIFKLCIEIVIDHDKSLVFKSSYASCEVLYIRSFTALQVFFTKVEKITTGGSAIRPSYKSTAPGSCHFTRAYSQ